MNATAAMCITIDNLGDISTYFGEGVAGRVLAEVARRLERSLQVPFTIESWGVAASPFQLEDGLPVWSRVDEALCAAAALPIPVGNNRIVVSLSCRNTVPDAQGLHTASQNSAQDYRIDMSAAALAYEALFNARFTLVEQPVCSASEPASVLYSECVVRLSDEDGRVVMPGVYMPALERLGLTQVFDRRIAQSVVEELVRRPDVVLGCNMSALSASVDLWWRLVFPRLVREAGVGQRMVIEISESARPYSFEAVAEFVSHIQQAGCRVALDDFGTGFSSIGYARHTRFDVIKIDAGRIRTRGSDAPQLLGHLISLARHVANEVVVGSVESEADLLIAHAAGARWVQGFLFGHPQNLAPQLARQAQVASLDARRPAARAGGAR
ncbi:EAL domain-containing protein (putative c-di-GMP-specific phosphodiesterase class I) [Neorhizobium galegae]|uniref:EAL domain-containing protein n=1 Tax=Neorhizobium galegae TaxID=399 RepID=UPI001AE2C686|nr:EAL domain-containing protein [Neorhizobium galegae]MBP2550584.1 EAL domain-containing protein (putative c-di-GMP-specific phosphodiesterase class I) [Neorhizobium galegae]